jgi:hypothetical protein
MLDLRLHLFEQLCLVVYRLLFLGHLDDLLEQSRLFASGLVRFILQVLQVRFREALDDQLVEQSLFGLIEPFEALKRW